MPLLKNTKTAEPDSRDSESSGKKFRVLLIKYLSPGISFIMLAILVVLAAFLYFNAYLSIGHAQSVAGLKQQILEEDLKSGDLARVLKSFESKTTISTINLEPAQNPFKQKWEIKK